MRSLFWRHTSILLLKEFNIFVAPIFSTYRSVLCYRTQPFTNLRWGEWRDVTLLTGFLKWMQWTQSWSYTKERGTDNIPAGRATVYLRWVEHWQNKDWHGNPGALRVKPVTEPKILAPQTPHKLLWIWNRAYGVRNLQAVDWQWHIPITKCVL
jgi:hypothetical protein